jgi:hypothetical protein
VGQLRPRLRQTQLKPAGNRKISGFLLQCIKRTRHIGAAFSASMILRLACDQHPCARDLVAGHHAVVSAVKRGSELATDRTKGLKWYHTLPVEVDLCCRTDARYAD